MKLSALYIPISLVALSAVLTACSDRPENVASDKEMVKIMTDMELAEAYIQTHGATMSGSESRERIVEYVLRKHNMSREDFDSTLSWYGRHIDKYDELYAKVDRELAERGKKMSGDIQDMNSTDLWPYSRHIFISSLSSSDNMTFSLTPSEELQKGDVLKWRLHPDASVSGSVTLGVVYKNGMTYYVNQPLMGAQSCELKLQTDTALEIKKIFGNLRTADRSGIVKIDSITLQTSPFDSMEYYRINTLRKFPGPQRKIFKKQDIAEKDSTEKTS